MKIANMSFSEFLCEMSQEIEDIENKNKEEARLIFLSYFNIDMCTKVNDLYIMSAGLKPTEFIVYELNKNKEPVGATIFEQTGVVKNNKEEFAYIPKYTLSWGASSNFMYRAYGAFSKYKGAYIMSDGKQTKFSKAKWKEWYNNKTPSEDIFAYNVETKEVEYFEDIEASWCRTPECRKYRIVTKFD